MCCSCRRHNIVKGSFRLPITTITLYTLLTPPLVYLACGKSYAYWPCLARFSRRTDVKSHLCPSLCDTVLPSVQRRFRVTFQLYELSLKLIKSINCYMREE